MDTNQTERIGKQLSTLLGLKAVQSELAAQKAAAAEERSGVLRELAALKAGHARRQRERGAERDMREGVLRKAAAAYEAALAGFREAQGDLLRADALHETERARLERRLHELGNGRIEGFLRDARMERQQVQALRTWRETREHNGLGGVRLGAVEVTSSAILDHLQELEAAIGAAESLLTSELAPAEIEERIGTLEQRARIGQARAWGPT